MNGLAIVATHCASGDKLWPQTKKGKFTANTLNTGFRLQKERAVSAQLRLHSTKSGTETEVQTQHTIELAVAVAVARCYGAMVLHHLAVPDCWQMSWYVMYVTHPA